MKGREQPQEGCICSFACEEDKDWDKTVSTASDTLRDNRCQ